MIAYKQTGRGGGRIGGRVGGGKPKKRKREGEMERSVSQGDVPFSNGRAHWLTDDPAAALTDEHDKRPFYSTPMKDRHAIVKTEHADAICAIDCHLW